MRRLPTVMALVIAVALGSDLAVCRMPTDIGQWLAMLVDSSYVGSRKSH